MLGQCKQTLQWVFVRLLIIGGVATYLQKSTIYDSYPGSGPYHVAFSSFQKLIHLHIKEVFIRSTVCTVHVHMYRMY
jgi:hypothetical protein